jgi:hypothetical protein
MELLMLELHDPDEIGEVSLHFSAIELFRDTHDFALLL